MKHKRTKTEKDDDYLNMDLTMRQHKQENIRMMTKKWNSIGLQKYFTPSSWTGCHNIMIHDQSLTF